ncbi:MAG: DUF3329 domain-containing protein, partial [Perlucidibaca sp.]
MNNPLPERETGEIAIAFVLASVIGLLVGHVALSLLVVVGWFLFRNLRQLERLKDWLQDTRQDVPESEGTWDEVFKGIY